MIEFVDLAKQQARLKTEIDAGIQDVLAHGRYILGPEVAVLEERLANYAGVKHCITCANGTDALQIALMSLNPSPGDEVITPSFSYIAAAEAIVLLGLKPVYVDIDPATFNLDVDQIEQKVTDKTCAILPVSLYGQCPDFNAINKVAAKFSIPVIEDAAQSFGATQEGRYSCALSDIATTSFFPSKPLGCYGDGGAIFTDSDERAQDLRQIARHGQAGRYNHVRIGVNSRLDTIQAAVLLPKLSILTEEIEMRNAVAKHYYECLSDAAVQLPIVSNKNTSAWAQFTVRVKNRDQIAATLKEIGIPTTVHYPAALHQQPALKEVRSDLPESERAASEVLSLPMHPYLSKEQISEISEKLRGALQ